MATTGGLCTLLNDPAYAEFVFNCMMQSSAEDRRSLSPRELRYFSRTHERGAKNNIRKFADTMSIATLHILVKLGYQFSIVITPKAYSIEPVLKKSEVQYDNPEARRLLVEEMAKEKTFIITSNDVMVSLHMAGQNSHSQTYILNYDYIDLHAKMQSLRSVKTNYNSLIADAKDAMKGVEAVCGLYLAMMNTENILDTICGVNENELKILLCLFPRRNTFTTHETIANAILDYKVGYATTVVLISLEKKELIACEPGPAKAHKNKKYMIISKGIDAVMNYIRYLQKETFK